MWLEQLQDEIARRLGRGENLSEVQAELVESAIAVSEDERAALWLFAWSYEASGRDHSERVPAGLAR